MNTATGTFGEGGGRVEQHQDFISGHGAFAGTDNPRHLRVLLGLLRRPMPREHVDREAGASNGPDIISELRRRGLTIPCDRAPVLDRDGREVQRGIYHLTDADRRKIRRWFAAPRTQHG